MRAVNLIPADLRRGGGAGAAGRSGGAIYVILAALVALVALGIVYGVTTHRIADRQSQVALATRGSQADEARAAALQPFIQVDTRRAARVQLVGGLAVKRFNWSLAMRQIAKALPTDASLTKLVGSNTPGGTGGGSLRGSIPVPAIELNGCARTQPRVAAAIDSLRRIPGVQVVSLGSSVKPSASSAGGGGGGGGVVPPGCGTDPPSFDVIVYYTSPTAPGAPQATSTISVSPKAAVLR